MYQALYRKYRPKTFDEVAGQEVVVKTLKNSVTNNKINHAYLFAGPRGCGKTTIAKIFAKLVNCENSSNGIPCNKCVCCTQSNEQNMDVIEMDAASNNGVDEIREINNKVKLAPTLGKYKIYIIDEVHMLTIGAFNALLKTLEEPPAHVIFILATTDPHKVPITILSRCQRFDLKKISDEQIYNRLKYICDNENIKIEEDAIFEIARLGDGSLRDAISILDQVVAYTNETITLNDIHEVNGTISQDNVFELINCAVNNNLTGVINKINEYSNRGKSIVKITEEIILFLRNSILFKTTSDFVEDKKNIYREITKKVSTKKMLEYISIMNESLLDMKKFSNPKMILELAFIRMMNNSYKQISTEKVVEKTIIEKPNIESNIITQEIKQPEKITKKIKAEVKTSNTVDNKNISGEITKKAVDNELLEKFNKFVEIRVNNTLSKFSKKDTIELKNALNKVMDYVMDEKYNVYATMVLDGQLKAVSDEYAIFTYKTEHLSNLFNENIINIENLIKEVFNKSYKVVAVDIDKWNIIKDNFNSKKQKFEYHDEIYSIEEILSKLNNEPEDDMKSLFGDIVEYN